MDPLLTKHFSDTLHDEILTEIGFAAGEDRDWTMRGRRDPRFRARVLLAQTLARAQAAAIAERWSQGARAAGWPSPAAIQVVKRRGDEVPAPMSFFA